MQSNTKRVELFKTYRGKKEKEWQDFYQFHNVCAVINALKTKMGGAIYG